MPAAESERPARGSETPAKTFVSGRPDTGRWLLVKRGSEKKNPDNQVAPGGHFSNWDQNYTFVFKFTNR